ncbi:hypothetical protein Verru16b_00765 [Lacunisphaera limnophila]|uniref:CobW/HypB/UreG nucleotide-binding domain-containing protein n=1 Tax=Lacunisphaera limnophila TaxID=1838286 RepID=A0A1D8AS36_9BACT|nr:hypothetical protein [Lacunisphaera limnophila]AOS43711.1 hypothetical protein Verru16b_00765 [Lacunisphaera limnophila]
MSSPIPNVYFILGTPGSGRRAIVRDLIENGFTAEEKVVVLLPGGETASPEDGRLAALAQADVRRWTWQAPGIPVMELPVGATVFLLADPLASPIDQVEALKPWLQQQGRELARIFTVVDCGLAEKNPVLRQWFDACIHFSDVVFLTNRVGLANKWLSDFISHFKDQRFPCHFLQVKTKGVLPTPLVWLDPTPRRVSQYFEEDYVDLSDVVIETGDDEAEEGEAVQPGEEDGIIPPEPYFVRQTSGRRDKELPDIRNFLPKQ